MRHVYRILTEAYAPPVAVVATDTQNGEDIDRWIIANVFGWQPSDAGTRTEGYLAYRASNASPVRVVPVVLGETTNPRVNEAFDLAANEAVACAMLHTGNVVETEEHSQMVMHSPEWRALHAQIVLARHAAGAVVVYLPYEGRYLVVLPSRLVH